MSTWIDMPYTLSGKGIAAGKKGDVTHLVIMKCDDPRIGMIGLLQWVDPPLPAPEIPTSVGYGTPVFVVDTEDAAGSGAARGGAGNAGAYAGTHVQRARIARRNAAPARLRDIRSGRLFLRVQPGAAHRRSGRRRIALTGPNTETGTPDPALAHAGCSLRHSRH